VTAREVSFPGAGDDAPGSRPRFGGLRSLLAVRSFRGLWLAGTLSSFGDWLALLATTSLAAVLARDQFGAYLAVSGVFILRILPALVLGPFAGVVADRLDRRRTMVVGDVLRGTIFVSIPLVGTLWWMYLAIVLSECVSLFWGPAKDATVPNLVPRSRLELANQLNLVSSYGTAPLAALLFSALTYAATTLEEHVPVIGPSGLYLAVYLNGLTFYVSAVVVARLRFPAREAAERALAGQPVHTTIADGLALLRERPAVRGLVIGMLGAFASGGLVIGLSREFVDDLGAGAPGYGLLFVSVFTGMALGLVAGPRIVRSLDRARAFTVSLVASGVVLVVLALVPVLEVALVAAVVLGGCVGTAWVLGYTLLGLTVDDIVRGRTFALVQTLDGVVLVVVLALAPLLAGAFDGVFGLPRTLDLGPVALTYTGAMVTYVVAGLGMALAGRAAWRRMGEDARVGRVRLPRAPRNPGRRREGPDGTDGPAVPVRHDRPGPDDPQETP
jgi:MFS family permease